MAYFLLLFSIFENLWKKKIKLQTQVINDLKNLLFFKIK